MNREQVIATLRAHESELKRAGVVHLSLFGSTVRGDRGSDSDIDLLAAFDESRRMSLLDVIHIENQIADLLGEEVDFLVEGTLEPHIQENVARKPRWRTHSCVALLRAAPRLFGALGGVPFTTSWVHQPPAFSFQSLPRRGARNSLDSILVDKDLAPLKAAAEMAIQKLRQNAGN